MRVSRSAAALVAEEASAEAMLPLAAASAAEAEASAVTEGVMVVSGVAMVTVVSEATETEAGDMEAGDTASVSMVGQAIMPAGTELPIIRMIPTRTPILTPMVTDIRLTATTLPR